jgi:transcriptional regulator with XRE-family HTH domain
MSAKNREDPARVARVEDGARAMLLISELTRLRESRALTQAALATSLGVSQARISQIEHQDDVTFSTLDQVVHGMGGELEIYAKFPSETIPLLGSVGGRDHEHPVRGSTAFEKALAVVRPTSRDARGPIRVYTVVVAGRLNRGKHADSVRIAAILEQCLVARTGKRPHARGGRNERRIAGSRQPDQSELAANS